MMTSTTSEVWKKQRKQPSQRDLENLDDDEDDIPPEGAIHKPRGQIFRHF